MTAARRRACACTPATLVTWDPIIRAKVCIGTPPTNNPPREIRYTGVLRTVPREASDGERRQSYCPECGERGSPATVSFGPKGRVISYKCPACGQEWLVQTESPPAVSDRESK